MSYLFSYWAIQGFIKLPLTLFSSTPSHFSFPSGSLLFPFFSPLPSLSLLSSLALPSLTFLLLFPSLSSLPLPIFPLPLPLPFPSPSFPFPFFLFPTYPLDDLPQQFHSYATMGEGNFIHPWGPPKRSIFVMRQHKVVFFSTPSKTLFLSAQS